MGQHRPTRSRRGSGTFTALFAALGVIQGACADPDGDGEPCLSAVGCITVEHPECAKGDDCEAMPTPVVGVAPLSPGPPPTLEPCNPLSDWLYDVPFEAPIVTARSESELYAVTRWRSAEVVWALSDGSLRPHRVASRVETPERLVLGVEDAAQPFALVLSPPPAPTDVRLLTAVEGQLAAELASGTGVVAGVPLALEPADPTLERRLSLPYASPARVEAHVSRSDGLAFLVVGPLSPSDDASLRVFAGRDGELIEVQPSAVTRTSGAAPMLQLSLEVDGVAADLELEVSPRTEAEAPSSGSGILRSGEGEARLAPGPQTRLSLAGLRFSCSPSGVSGWRLSNDPPEHDPAASCPLPAPGSPAVPEEPAFACYTFPADLELTSPEVTGRARFRAEVLELGTGLPPEGSCRGRAEDALARDAAASLLWARLGANDREGFLVFESRGVPLPLTASEAVDVTFTYGRPSRRPFALAPGSGDFAYSSQARFASHELAVRDSTGQLRVWAAAASDMAELTPITEIALSRGPEQCATRSGCYSVSQYALRARLGDAVRVVSYGETALHGGFLIINNGLDVATAPIDGCYDGSAGGINAELWRTALP